MTNLSNFLEELQAKGVKFYYNVDGKIHWTAEKGVMTPEIQSILTTNKREILQLLQLQRTYRILMDAIEVDVALNKSDSLEVFTKVVQKTTPTPGYTHCVELMSPDKKRIRVAYVPYYHQ
ncbi:hypothetical protein D2Q93_14745 [Alicyclobacillaceae bacterium I2511]|nr:hypothetical protein D2Q93_14745 [Alicyclobacillaceae bacterium I2511]